MTQYSFPWNDVHGDRLYDADDFMRFFAAFLKTGVVMSYKGGLRVRSAQDGMNIQVGSGSAVIEGSSYLNDADIGIQVNVASSIQDRVDSIVLRMDKNARTTQLFYKPGDTTVARNDTTYELQLAKISVKTNTTQITDADITDMRSDFTVCGWSTPFDNINVDGIVDQYKEIFEQKDLEFQAWFKNLKKQLDDNQASNLQNQIDNLGSEKANDHEVVHKTGDESIAGKKTFTGNVEVNGRLTLPTKSWSGQLGGGITLSLRKKGTTVEYSIGGEISSNILANSNLVNLSVPNEFRPRNRCSLVGHMAGRWDSFHIDIQSSGACQWFGPIVNRGTPRGTGTYPID
ncbi:receptor binding protein [Lactococcus phage 63301]|uniref:head protein n=1 Tax=Lactococcus phage 63301 TaxID=1871687 RepID=UPI00080950BE|nr:head protein [Lactococcus phage 63301]ANS02641.1 receptor binding protein [Lactococcus phage 63301]